MTCWGVILNEAKRNEESDLQSIIKVLLKTCYFNDASDAVKN